MKMEAQKHLKLTKFDIYLILDIIFWFLRFWKPIILEIFYKQKAITFAIQKQPNEVSNSPQQSSEQVPVPIECQSKLCQNSDQSQAK